MVRSHQSTTRWESVSGVVALVVGFCALCTTAYTAYLQRNQAHSAVWPRVMFGTAGPDFHFEILNKGVGPAIIERVDIRVDGVPITTWQQGLRRVLGQAPPSLRVSTLSGTVLTPGETLSVLSFGDRSVRDRVEAARSRFSVQICYCSIYNQCWSFDDRDDQTRLVPACRKPDDKSFGM